MALLDLSDIFLKRADALQPVSQIEDCRSAKHIFPLRAVLANCNQPCQGTGAKPYTEFVAPMQLIHLYRPEGDEKRSDRARAEYCGLIYDRGRFAFTPCYSAKRATGTPSDFRPQGRRTCLMSRRDISSCRTSVGNGFSKM